MFKRRGVKVNQVNFAQDDNTLSVMETNGGVKISVAALQSQSLMAKTAGIYLNKNQIRRLRGFLDNLLESSD